MDNFSGIFEVLAADDSDARLSSRRALVLSETRINQRLGKFLEASRTPSDFDARLAYVDDDFKGIIAVACEETGHGNPEAIYASLKAHYRPAEIRTASVVHEARKPKMCPYHSEVVDISLGAADPKAGYDVMQSHAWGDKHCQGEWDGKCNFKREMVTQSFWDDRQKALDEQREERQQPASPVPQGVDPSLEDNAPVEPIEPIGEPEGISDDNVIDFPAPEGPIDNGGSQIDPPALAIAASVRHQADDVACKQCGKPMNPVEAQVSSTHGVCAACTRKNQKEATGRVANQFIKERGGKWVVTKKDDGSVIGTHDSKEKAEAAFRGMEWNKHKGSLLALAGEIENAEGALGLAPADIDAVVALRDIYGLDKSSADYNPSNQDDDSDKKVPCPECGGDGKTNGGKKCPRCKGQGHVNDWGPSVLDAVGSSVRTADNGKGNTGLGGPEPVIDKRKWTPQNVRKIEVPSGNNPTEEKDPIEPIKAVNDDSLKEIGEKTTEKTDLPSAGGNLDDAGFASNNMPKGPDTKTWTGTDGQAQPVTSKADDVELNPIRQLLTDGFDGFVTSSVIDRLTAS